MFDVPISPAGQHVHFTKKKDVESANLQAGAEEKDHSMWSSFYFENKLPRDSIDLSSIASFLANETKTLSSR
jgi:hypothetical protein